MSPTPLKRVTCKCPICGLYFTLCQSEFRKKVKAGIRPSCSRICARHWWPLVKAGKVPA